MKKEFDPYHIVKFRLTPEKVVRFLESENKLLFIVKKSASKADIKKSVEESFKVKVLKVNTQITPAGRKKAYVKLSAENPAIDVATQLGLL